MTKEELEARLPDEHCEEMRKWVFRQYKDSELGGEMAVYHREAMEIAPEIGRTMTQEDWARRSKETKRKWGAQCTCSACENEFTAGYIPGVGISLVQGEDGLLYDGWCENDEEGAIAIAEGDGFTCPCCGEEVTLVRKSKIKNGRTWQLQTVSVEVIEDFTVLMYWMVSRHLDPCGYIWSEIRPRDAVVLLPGGRVWRFTKTKHGQHSGRPLDQWEPCGTLRDPQQMRYYDWASFCNKKMGAVVWPKMPDLTGTSGEKTGIADYIKGGGEWPLVYYKTWAYHPAIENLVKAGWTKMLDGYINHKVSVHTQYRHETSIVDFEFINWESAKPHEMLYMTKEEVRNGRAWNWNFHRMMIWQNLYLNGSIKSATDFQNMVTRYGGNVVFRAEELLADGWLFDIYRVCRYLDRQCERSARGITPKQAAQYWIDYIDMAERVTPGGMDEEQLWPRDIYEAHERYREMQEALEKDDYREGFARVIEICGGLEWTDGELCIRLPRCNEDLRKEGKTLRHCVGGYGKKHAGGKDLIFFVRKYRRPERSYYTLNESIKDYHPRRIQLHGYGNEFHGGSKSGIHSIPKNVKEFVSRWEREVLAPWCEAMAAAELEKKKGRRMKTE